MGRAWLVALEVPAARWTARWGLPTLGQLIKKTALASGLSLGRKRLIRRAAISCCTAAYNEPFGAFTTSRDSFPAGAAPADYAPPDLRRERNPLKS